MILPAWVTFKFYYIICFENKFCPRQHVRQTYPCASYYCRGISDYILWVILTRPPLLASEVCDSVNV